MVQQRQRVKRKPAKRGLSRYSISRNRLDAAWAEIERPATDKTVNKKRPYGCLGNVADMMQRKSCHLVTDNRLQQAAKAAIVCHDWPLLLKTLVVMSRNPRHTEQNVILRNTFFALVGCPSVTNPSALRSYVSTHPLARNVRQMNSCIKRIIKCLQGGRQQTHMDHEQHASSGTDSLTDDNTDDSDDTDDTDDTEDTNDTVDLETVRRRKKKAAKKDCGRYYAHDNAITPLPRDTPRANKAHR